LKVALKAADTLISLEQSQATDVRRQLALAITLIDLRHVLGILNTQFDQGQSTADTEARLNRLQTQLQYPAEHSSRSGDDG